VSLIIMMTITIVFKVDTFEKQLFFVAMKHIKSITKTKLFHNNYTDILHVFGSYRATYGLKMKKILPSDTVLH